MRLSTDRARCCSSGMCVITAPEVFDQDDEDGRVLLLDPTPSPALHEAVRQAIEVCPCGVITEEIGPG
ncbi:ferredoxin [Streptomyces natalensis]|uniref:Ferredoxin n=1 Tax=Streptomyces natalensis ATCC 27448 TaxID=1240678 RepID=A0A0D7CFQ9_9ACTN|nr:ferredoxin [Streptomyces natalensis]KIZ14871.1 ferredoxin [Streptomyces natalensis ATCC 27448]